MLLCGQTVVWGPDWRGRAGIGRFPACHFAQGAGLEGFLGPQPRPLIECVPALIVCVTVFSSPPALRRRGAITKALQAITRALQTVTKLLRSGYQSLRSRYQSYEPLRSWMAPRSLCLTTAFTPALTFLGGSCPLGCSLSALPQGDSLWLAQCSCMRQAPRKRCGPVADFMGDIIAQ